MIFTRTVSSDLVSSLQLSCSRASSRLRILTPVPVSTELKVRFCGVNDLIWTVDYRRIPRALSQVYYSPLTPETSQEIDKIFHAHASEDPNDPPIPNRKLNTWGRTLLVPESTSTVAKFNFNDLCGQPLSAADYIEITKNFNTLFILGIPKMGMDSKDLVRQSGLVKNIHSLNTYPGAKVYHVH